MTGTPSSVSSSVVDDTPRTRSPAQRGSVGWAWISSWTVRQTWIRSLSWRPPGTQAHVVAVDPRRRRSHAARAPGRSRSARPLERFRTALRGRRSSCSMRRPSAPPARWCVRRRSARVVSAWRWPALRVGVTSVRRNRSSAASTCTCERARTRRPCRASSAVRSCTGSVCRPGRRYGRGNPPQRRRRRRHRGDAAPPSAAALQRSSSRADAYRAARLMKHAATQSWASESRLPRSRCVRGHDRLASGNYCARAWVSFDLVPVGRVCRFGPGNSHI